MPAALGSVGDLDLTEPKPPEDGRVCSVRRGGRRCGGDEGGRASEVCLEGSGGVTEPERSIAGGVQRSSGGCSRSVSFASLRFFRDAVVAASRLCPQTDWSGGINARREGRNGRALITVTGVIDTRSRLDVEVG